MGTLSRRGRHSEVASTTSDDEGTADWPAGGQRPGIPQEEGGAANEERGAANEERGAANEERGAANEEIGAANEERGAANEEGGAANEERGAANEEGEAANENGGAPKEDGGATSEEKGGGSGRRGQPHSPEGNPEDGGRSRWPGTCGDDARENRVVPEPEGTRPDDSGTRDQQGDLHRASHSPGGSWLWKVRSLWTNRGAP
ncbi:hypothetical protein NDU88_007431 [Pleurodeles waltl]|uniref:Pr1-like protein n=1 Tax=Pleurodeles waltl TaxID=8319 RepID=A0AAV7U3M2_PLEWA|nr:hypothetical protein NDU88_007431 [Pleurodeles waltl]